MNTYISLSFTYYSLFSLELDQMRLLPYSLPLSIYLEIPKERYIKVIRTLRFL